MNVTPEEAQRLLDAVKAATLDTEQRLAYLEAEIVRLRMEARQGRMEAVQAAMDAGIPRKDIAAAAGVTPARLYQIAEGRR